MITLFLIIPLTLLLLGLVSRIHGKRAPYPPGPKGFPVIGNINMMDQLTHRGLANLAKQYGAVFHLRMGFLHMVTISNAEAARQVLQVQDNIFSNRPANIAIKYLTYNRSDLVFAHYGSFWRQIRKLCVMKLFSRKRQETWRAVREEIDAVVRAVEANVGKPVNIGDLVFNLTKNITYRAAFGSNSKEGQDEFIAIIQEFSKLFGELNIADFIPCLKWIDPQGLNARLVEARGALDRFIDKIIDEHMEKKKRRTSVCKCDDDSDMDMVDELLAFYSDEAKLNNDESDDLHNSIKLSKDNIKGIIMDLMFGGTETVALTIEWAMADLMRSPQDLKCVQQELVAKVGLDHRVEEQDIEKLTYLRCAIKETLRLHPPIPLLLHETAENATVIGYFIPKGSRVMINVWAIARDTNWWEEPEAFKPSRFLNPIAPDFNGSNFEFIPFGSGRRSCPGMQLGMYTLELAVAHLLHYFTWELPDGMKPSEMNMHDVNGLSAAMANRLVAIPTKRVICPL